MCSSKVCSCVSPLKIFIRFPEQPIRRRLRAAVAFVTLGLGPMLAQIPADPAADGARPAPAGEFFGNLSGRISGLLDVDLPRFDPPGTFRLQFNPRVGDLFRRDYIRVPVGLRWTANERFELSSEAEAYFTHNQKPDGAGHGIGELRFGVRHLIPQWPGPEWQTSVGFITEIPIGTPPLDMTDGRNHYVPSIIVEHRSLTRPRWTTFGGLSADIITESSVAGQRIRNTPSDDALSFTAGAIYDLGAVKWTVQATYTTSVISDYDEHIFSVRPSVLWFLPREYTFNSKTQWIVGIGVRGTWGPDGFDLSTGSRVRAEITFQQAVRRLRQTIAGD
jgi:hypothetical protein